MNVAVERMVLQIRYLRHTDLSSNNIHLGNNTYWLFFMDLVIGIARDKSFKETDTLSESVLWVREEEKRMQK